MPIFLQTSIDSSSVMIWHITEEEQFFMEQSGLISNKIHLKKRLEYLASRYCLQQLLPELNMEAIKIDPEGKPYIHNSSIDFSISHSYPYVAVAINKQHKIGIDIQTKQEKILRLQTKFLSTQEMTFCNDDVTLITYAWCCKEAMYKKYALGGLDFKQNMPIQELRVQNNRALAQINFNFHDQNYIQKIEGFIEDNFTWAITTES